MDEFYILHDTGKPMPGPCFSVHSLLYLKEKKHFHFQLLTIPRCTSVL